MTTIPAAALGSWISGRVESDILKAILGVGLIAVSFSSLRSSSPKDVTGMDKNIEQEYGGDKAETCQSSASGEEICYRVCNRNKGMAIAGPGGLFAGMISTGPGELNDCFLLRQCRVPGKVS